MPPRLKKGRISADDAPVEIAAELLNPMTVVANHPSGSVQVSRMPSFDGPTQYRVTRINRRPHAVAFAKVVAGAEAALKVFRAQWSELAAS